MVDQERRSDLVSTLRREPFVGRVGYSSVFHVTYRWRLGDIAQEGLKTEKFGSGFLTDLKAIGSSEEIDAVNSIFNASAEQVGITLRRNNVVFASPDIRSRKGLPIEMVILELNVNSDDCLVADKDLYDDCLNSQSFQRQYETALRYWRSSLKLSDYSRETCGFKYPEVLIPCDIFPEHIRISNS